MHFFDFETSLILKIWSFLKLKFGKYADITSEK